MTSHGLTGVVLRDGERVAPLAADYDQTDVRSRTDAEHGHTQLADRR